MECILEIKNLSRKYGSRGFTNFNFKLNSLEHVCIIGQVKSGKTSLLKEISNYSTNETSLILGDNMILPTVKNEILRSINNADKIQESPEKYLDQIIDYFKLDKIIENRIEDLNDSQNAYINIIKEIITKPDIIAIDCLFSLLDNDEKNLIINYANYNNVTIICVTNNLNDLKYFTRTCVMSNFIILMDDRTENILTADILLKRLGLKLPLPVYLSLGLTSYEIINEIYYDTESLVNKLWK